tara:strand:+ start:133 stop:378 length:246 start_codon:yes stop_codon:yes gene_type:complete
MKKNVNVEVARLWSAGVAAENHRGSFHTDGQKLWSYGLLIGDTASGTKVVRDHTAGGRHDYYSQTTSTHVGIAKRFADLVD